jgi:hypothetical protein
MRPRQRIRVPTAFTAISSCILLHTANPVSTEQQVLSKNLVQNQRGVSNESSNESVTLVHSVAAKSAFSCMWSGLVGWNYDSELTLTDTYW